MVLDKLQNLPQYVALHPLFAEVAKYLNTQDLSMLTPQKYELMGERLYINIAQIPPKTKKQATLEAHRKYIDIQIPISGIETIGYAPIQEHFKESIAFDERKDIVFFENEAENYLVINPGMFAIFFPGDAHAPGITPYSMKKAVIKIEI